MTTDALARKSTVIELVAAFRETERVIRESFAAIVEAEKALNAVFTLGGDHPIRIGCSRYHYHDANFAEPGETIAHMQREAWGVIVQRLELHKAMSIARFKELEAQLKDGELPPITEDNVTAFVENAMGSLGEMMREAIQEVFDWLRPHHSELKTNSEYEVPSKVILGWVVDQGWNGKGFRINHYRQQNIIALENVFNALAGQGQVAKQYQSALQVAIEASTDGTGETDLFTFKAFKNHNLHLTFKRLDLLAAFNAIAGGKRLHKAA